MWLLYSNWINLYFDGKNIIKWVGAWSWHEHWFMRTPKSIILTTAINVIPVSYVYTFICYRLVSLIINSAMKYQHNNLKKYKIMSCAWRLSRALLNNNTWHDKLVLPFLVSMAPLVKTKVSVSSGGPCGGEWR